MTWRLIAGDAREQLATLPDASVQTVVTSPPYWGLRDYGAPGQLGLEPTPEEYVANLVEVFREVRRVLRDDGTVWLNLGDFYATSPPGNKATGVEKWASSGLHGTVSEKYAATLDASVGKKRNTVVGTLKPKDLVGIPWRVAFALQADGWYLRADIIWAKSNPMPESVTDRPTKAHEYVFLLSKSARYFYDADAVREPLSPVSLMQIETGTTRRGNKWADARTGRNDGDRQAAGTRPGDMMNPAGRNLRSVWNIATEPIPEAHFATFPKKLVEPCVKAGTSEKGCCPQCGAAWVRVVEREGLSSRDWQALRGVGTKGADARMGLQGKSIAGGRPPDPSYRTAGWHPSCAHAADPVPCVVLDPFAGSGTVGVVALRLGRDFIGIELNPEYVEMARKRIENDAPLFNIGTEVTPTTLRPS